MEWFQNALERRNKSVVSNANRAVSNMTNMMQTQTDRLRQIEGVVKSFETIALDSLRSEINSLEKRKRELALEQDTIDVTLANRRLKLVEAQSMIADLNRSRSGSNGDLSVGFHAAGSSSSSGAPSAAPSSSSSSKPPSPGDRRRADSAGSASRSQGGRARTNSGVPEVFSLSSAPRPHPEEDELEMDYMEEREMLDTIRGLEALQHVLFVLQRTDEDYVLLFQPASASDPHGEPIVTRVLRDDSGLTPPGPLSHTDARLGLEARVVRNDEREYPDVMQMSIPPFAAPALKSFLRTKKGGVAGATSQGELVTSVEIPAIQEVVVDIWRTEGWMWATTTVSDVQFAVLERIVVAMDVQEDGASYVSSIDLFSRHPTSGHIVEESIMRVNH